MRIEAVRLGGSRGMIVKYFYRMNYKSCFPCISSAPPQDWWDPSTASANASAFHISAESATTASTRFHPTHGHGPQGRDTNIESSLLTSRLSKAAHWGRPYPTSLVDIGAQGKGEKGKINPRDRSLPRLQTKHH